ncbi:hypothetical protein ACX12M_18645 [Cellulosimicrobium cellulans]
MTSTTEGDLLTDLARADDEVLAASEVLRRVETFDSPEWFEAHGIWADAVDRRDAIIRQLDERRQP